MSKAIAVSVVAPLALLLLIAGCGGGSDATTASNASQTTASSESGEPLTRAEFIKQGDAICQKADDATYLEARRYSEAHAKELSKFEPIPREEKLIRLFVLPNVVKEARGLEALPAPKKDSEQIESFIEGIEVALKKAKKNPYAVEGEVGYGENPFHDIDIRFREYGFQVCSILT
jgi:hypothetical protein